MHEAPFQGQLQDISSGGCRLLIDRTLTVSDFIRCGLYLLGAPVAIPVLCRICWIQKNAEGEHYLAGTHFVI